MSRFALAALLALASAAPLSGCSGGEVQASDVEAYQKAGLPAEGAASPAADERPER